MGKLLSNRRRFLKTAAGIFLPTVTGLVRAQPFTLNDPAFLAATRPKSSGAWTPASVSGLVVWFKADVAVYSDLGTTPITDGGSVEQWNDQSGNGFNFTQTTLGNRPTWSNTTGTINGLPIVKFTDSSSQFLTGSPTHASSNFTAFAVLARNTAAGTHYAFDSQTGRLLLATSTSSGTDTIGWLDSNGTLRQAAEILSTTAHLIVWRLNSTGTGGFVYVDNVQKLNAVYTATAIGGSVALGSRYAGDSNYGDYQFGEFGIWASDIGTTQIGNLHAYSQTRWGTA